MTKYRKGQLRIYPYKPATYRALRWRYQRSQGTNIPASGKLIAGFTTRYNVDKLVYYEVASDPTGAITREKQIKAGSRQKKIDLINSMNWDWRDLYDEI
jgi:hypothetical protein